jgi:hypothetical protein
MRHHRDNLRTTLGDERGSAIIAAIGILSVMLVLTAAAFNITQHLQSDLKRTTAGQRAFAAANAGVDRALARINSYLPAANTCITDVPASPVAPASNGWCADSPAESLGQGASFTYRVSVSASPVSGCGGVTLQSGALGDRCVVGTGTADGVTRRVAVRLAIQTTTYPFQSNTSLIGYKEVKIKKKSSVESDVATNGKFTKEKDGAFTGNLKLGPKGKAKGYTGPFTRLTSPLVPTLPDFTVYDPSTGTRRDSALWNDNQTAIAPFLGTTKLQYDATKRELTVKDGVTLTLSPGVYNFCKLTLNKDARIVVVPPAAGATVPKDAVRIFLDGKERAGSRCSDGGGLDGKTGSSFINSSADPRTLQVYAWGKKTKVKVPNTSNFSGIIWAPRAKVKFNSHGTLTGGVSADKIETHKDMKVKWSPLIDTWTVPASNASQVVSWRQCRSVPPASPYDGCPTS